MQQNQRHFEKQMKSGTLIMTPTPLEDASNNIPSKIRFITPIHTLALREKPGPILKPVEPVGVARLSAYKGARIKAP